MASTFSRRQITQRDLDIFAALFRCPLTPAQLLTLSATWEQPFTSLRRARERLHDLAAAGQLRSWRYATTGQGSGPSYHKLTLQGYHMLCGRELPPPTKRFFNEIAVARHRHTECLADFIVKLYVSAHRCGVQITDFYPENTFSIRAGENKLYTDGTATLVTPQGLAFPVHLEVDNSTETVRTNKRRDTIESKIRLYVEHTRRTGGKDRTLFITTVSRQRLETIFEAVAVHAADMPCQLFYGVHLDDYLATENAFYAPCFRTLADKRTPLLRPRTVTPAPAYTNVPRPVVTAAVL